MYRRTLAVEHSWLLSLPIPLHTFPKIFLSNSQAKCHDLDRKVSKGRQKEKRCNGSSTSCYKFITYYEFDVFAFYTTLNSNEYTRKCWFFFLFWSLNFVHRFCQTRHINSFQTRKNGEWKAKMLYAWSFIFHHNKDIQADRSIWN